MSKKLFLFVMMFLLLGPAMAQEPGEKMSLDIKGMDIVDVLKMLASKTELNLVIDKNVSGRVTVFLKDVSPRQALEMILASNSLVQEEKGGISRIMTVQDYEQLHAVKYRDPIQSQRVKLKHARPQQLVPVLAQVKSANGRIVPDEATGSIILFDTEPKIKEMAKMTEEMDLPLQTEVFSLNYARCDKVAEALQETLTQGIGSLKTDSRTNKVIVTDSATKMEKIKEMVLALDERTKEVEIDARIVQVNLSDKTSFGIDWEYVLNKKFDIRGMFGQVISTTGNKWTIGTAIPKEHNDYKAVIEVLQTLGETKILSSPRLTVANNESAKILVGSKQVYVTTSAIQGQTTTQTAESVNFVDVGVKLFVTPTISPDGFISMKLKPEVSSVVQSYKTSTGNIIPIVETSEAETTVLLEDGATIVIGGLMKEEKIKNVNKIPLVGDIPFLGAFFRNTVDETKKTELVIFLTCKITDFSKSKKEKNT